jgi:hypothetical protein
MLNTHLHLAPRLRLSEAVPAPLRATTSLLHFTVNNSIAPWSRVLLEKLTGG